MIKLQLAAPLTALLPMDEHGIGRPRTVILQSSTWEDARAEIKTRFPELARRIFTESGGLAPGFILVINDEVMPRGKFHFDIQESDEIALLAGLAGGCSETPGVRSRGAA